MECITIFCTEKRVRETIVVRNLRPAQVQTEFRGVSSGIQQQYLVKEAGERSIPCNN